MRRWSRTAATALGLLLTACGEPAVDTSHCTLVWKCGSDIYSVDCEAGEGGQLACQCERSYSRTGTCERQGMCDDVPAYLDDDTSGREQALLNLKSNTVACCGYSVSTDPAVCELTLE